MKIKIVVEFWVYNRFEGRLGCKRFVVRIIIWVYCEDLVYSLVIIVNKLLFIMYIWNLLKEVYLYLFYI